MHIIQKNDDGSLETDGDYIIVSDVSGKIIRTFKSYEEALEVFHKIQWLEIDEEFYREAK